MNLYQVAEEIARRLAGIFLRDEQGRRPVYGGAREVPGRPALARPHPVLRVLPRRQRRRPRRQPPDRLDRRRRPGHAPVRDDDARAGPRARQDAPALDARSAAPSGPAGGRRRERREPTWPAALSVAVPDQHARLADRAVARRWAGRPRWTTSPTPSWTAWPQLGFDWVWLLSVWQTGPAGQRVSRDQPEWRREFEETLPDLRDEDIAGSGFAITGYTVHPALGGDAALARLRERLRRARPAADARLRPQPHRPRSSLGRGAPRVLRRRDASSTWRAAPAELHAGSQRARRRLGSWPTGAIRTSPAGPTRCSSTTATRPRRRR